MSQKADKAIIYIDGGSRGNPGPSAAGFIITDPKGNLLCGKGVFLGHNTNNFAEYSGMVLALQAAKKLNIKQVAIFSDSQLMVRQIKGMYKVKSDNIKDLYHQAMSLLAEFSSWDVQHVLREKNKDADRLVNQALDVHGNVELEILAIKADQKPIRLGVLISGGGTTLLNIQELIDAGTLNAKVAIVISSLSKAHWRRTSKKSRVEC